MRREETGADGFHRRPSHKDCRPGPCRQTDAALADRHLTLSILASVPVGLIDFFSSVAFFNWVTIGPSLDPLMRISFGICGNTESTRITR